MKMTPTLFVFQGNFKPIICFIPSANNLQHNHHSWEMVKCLQSIDKVHSRTIRKISAIYSLYPFGCKNGSSEPYLVYIKEDKKRNELALKASKATQWLIAHVNCDKREADAFKIMGLTPQVATFVEAYGILPSFYPEKYPELMQSIEESYTYNRPQMMAWIKTTREMLNDNM